MNFILKSKFAPTGDQPGAIKTLTKNLASGIPHQTLLGVTGSGKTFTIANVIEQINLPTLVISHNKTLAAQLFEEFKEFFPENAVHYFVSYYDYYQPEAYIPQTDTYIEKDAKINDMIDAMRHASTASLLTRRDVIIVASVSCIYGIGDPEEYQKVAIDLEVGKKFSVKELIKQLVFLQYSRNPVDPRQGHFRTRENIVEIYLPSGEEIAKVNIENNKISSLALEKRARERFQVSSFKFQKIRIFPAKHFVTPQNKLALAVGNIKKELSERLKELKSENKILEAARLKQRTEFDMEMLESTGYVNGIENYSRHLDFRESGTPPYTLIDYFNYAYGKLGNPVSKRLETGFPSSWLCVIDESHATVPQLRGMYNGDRARKQTLIDYGFRLPSATDNRPLTFEEFNSKIRQAVYVSATPAPYEIEISSCKKLEAGSWKLEAAIAEQLIRPTGILDPRIEIRPTKNQIHDVISEIKKRVAKNERSLVMALTKRLAEDIAEYLADAGINAEYLHSEIKTLDRPGILHKLRRGEKDVIVGINLLREGLDLPEVSYIAILDAAKEGFLRNETTLLQIIGRAARHPDGIVILYADNTTGSMKAAMRESERRRKIQEAYNQAHNIIPAHIKKDIRQSPFERQKRETEIALPEGAPKEVARFLTREMKHAAKNLDFEKAAEIRDQLKKFLP